MAADESERRHRNAVDATGRQVGNNVRRLRQIRGLSTRELAKKLSEAGRPIPATGITRVENGARAVDVDDLITLAVVLGVSPLSLLLPQHAGRVETELTAVGTVPSWKAWRWGRAVEPLSEPPTDEEIADFQLHAAPKELSPPKPSWGA